MLYNNYFKVLNSNYIYSENNMYTNSYNYYENIKKVLIRLKNKIFSTVQKININEPTIDELILILKNNCNTLLDVFDKSFEIYEEEYYQFSSIKRMLFYILDNSLKNFTIIKELLISFLNLIQSKSELSSEEYSLKLNNFDIRLDSIEQKFYTEIYKPTESYDEEFLSDMSNSLLDLK